MCEMVEPEIGCYIVEDRVYHQRMSCQTETMGHGLEVIEAHSKLREQSKCGVGNTKWNRLACSEFLITGSNQVEVR